MPIHNIVDISMNKIWYLFSVLPVVTSAHQQTNDVKHYDGRHCAEHRSVPNDVEFLENRRKIDRVWWNEKRRCEVITWGIFTITDGLLVICLLGYLYKEQIKVISSCNSGITTVHIGYDFMRALYGVKRYTCINSIE